MTTHRPKLLGLLLVLLAFATQLGAGPLGAGPLGAGPLGAGIAFPRVGADAVLAAATICHAEDGRAPPVAPHRPDCALCQLCATVASTVFLAPADGPSVPSPRLAWVNRAAVLPRTTAPPATMRLAARPRAPPFQT
ncbi:MAG: hypothetical protein WCI94_13130 [Rhodospirillales bacterium]